MAASMKFDSQLDITSCFNSHLDFKISNYMLIKAGLIWEKFTLLKKMGNKLCQTVTFCSCLSQKDFEYEESMDPEEVKNCDSFENNIFTVSNGSFNLELLNQNRQMESTVIDRPLFVDTEFASSSCIADNMSLDSGFSSRNLTPIRSLSQINIPTPSLVLSVFNSDDTMNNFYEFLLSEDIFMPTNLGIDSLPLMMKDKICKWSKRSIYRIKQTAVKYFFFKNLTNKPIELTDENKSSKSSRIGNLIKRPFSIFDILASGLKFLNKFSLKHSSFNDCSDTISLIEPSYSYSPLRQFLIRIYDINFF